MLRNVVLYRETPVQINVKTQLCSMICVHDAIVSPLVGPLMISRCMCRCRVGFFSISKVHPFKHVEFGYIFQGRSLTWTRLIMDTSSAAKMLHAWNLLPHTVVHSMHGISYSVERTHAWTLSYQVAFPDFRVLVYVFFPCWCVRQNM